MYVSSVSEYSRCVQFFINISLVSFRPFLITLKPIPILNCYFYVILFYYYFEGKSLYIDLPT